MCRLDHDMKYFCSIYVIIQIMENNIDNITHVFELPFDGLCFFLEGTIFMKELTQTSVLE